MTRSLTAIAAITAVAVTGALAGPVAAATPAKRVDAKRASAVVKAPAAVARIVGSPLHGGPGMATGAECRAYAAAADAIVDQIEDDLLNGTDSGYDQNAVIDGILDAGIARGCVFTHD